MKLVLSIALLLFFSRASFAQTTTDNQELNNILIGLNGAANGVMIKTNWPSFTGGWERSFSLSNSNGSACFFNFGAYGLVNNGISQISYGYIGNNYLTPYMSFLPNGYVGIGKTYPDAKLEVFNTAQSGHLLLSSNDNPNADATRIDIDFHVADRGHTVGRIASFYESSTGGGFGGLRFYTRYGGELGERVRISSNGNVLIGKTTQDNTNYKLDVEGKVRANEITVVSTGADFVFENGYNLRPLTEVEAFVKANKHLPDVAPASEMQANGVSIGEMNAKLLQKVEELTLYLIELKRDNEDIRRENKEIKNEIQTLKLGK